jgi:transcriptional regulator with XRE-family HTH domain
MFPLTRKSTVDTSDTAREESRLRVFGKRLDMALKRAKISSGQVAKVLGVRETDVQFWRAGITAPVMDQCRRLAEYLNMPMQWLQYDGAM